MSVFAGVIQTVAYHKFGADGKAGEIGGDGGRHFVLGALEQDAEANFGRAAAEPMIGEETERAAGIEDVVDQQSGATVQFELGVEVVDEQDFAAGLRGVSIGLAAQEGDFDWEFGRKFAEQIGGEDESALEHDDGDGAFVWVNGCADFGGERFEARGDLRVDEQGAQADGKCVCRLEACTTSLCRRAACTTINCRRDACTTGSVHFLAASRSATISSMRRSVAMPPASPSKLRIRRWRSAGRAAFLRSSMAT